MDPDRVASPRRVSRPSLAVLAVLLSGLPGNIGAQVVFRQPPALSSAPAYQVWKQSGDSVSETFGQFSLPLSFFCPLGELGELNVYGLFAHSRYVGPAHAGELGALADLTVDYVDDIWRDRAAIALGLSLPIGATALTAREFFVAQQIASPLLPFRVKHYGEGLGIAGALALTGGDAWLYGASLRAAYRGSYVPIAGGPDYRPGSSVDLILQLVSEEHGWSFSAAGTLYATDALNDTAWFRDGPQLDLVAAWQTGHERRRHNLSLGAILRGKDRRRTAAGSLRTEAENGHGVDFRAAYEYAHLLSAAWSGRAGLAYKHLGSNAYALDSLLHRGRGDLVSLAADVVRRHAPGRLELGVTLFLGSAEAAQRSALAVPDERVAIKGLEIRAGYVWEW